MSKQQRREEKSLINQTKTKQIESVQSVQSKADFSSPKESRKNLRNHHSKRNFKLENWKTGKLENWKTGKIPTENLRDALKVVDISKNPSEMRRNRSQTATTREKILKTSWSIPRKSFRIAKECQKDSTECRRLGARRISRGNQEESARLLRVSIIQSCWFLV